MAVLTEVKNNSNIKENSIDGRLEMSVEFIFVRYRQNFESVKCGFL